MSADMFQELKMAAIKKKICIVLFSSLLLCACGSTLTENITGNPADTTAGAQTKTEQSEPAEESKPMIPFPAGVWQAWRPDDEICPILTVEEDTLTHHIFNWGPENKQSTNVRHRGSWEYFNNLDEAGLDYPQTSGGYPEGFDDPHTVFLNRTEGVWHFTGRYICVSGGVFRTEFYLVFLNNGNVLLLQATHYKESGATVPLGYVPLITKKED